ncbi:hypothetical protein HG1285_07383 [Hydrogenivirga sp. 128-5-R1-1]|nr:hypothetical protein HG1285_07383 [Hydrogenivirga sp. 128-5-R1-1]
MRDGFAYPSPYGLRGDNPEPPEGYPSASRLGLHIAGAGILTCFPSATPLGLALGYRLTRP